jgi:hypothetical protein
MKGEGAMAQNEYHLTGLSGYFWYPVRESRAVIVCKACEKDFPVRICHAKDPPDWLIRVLDYHKSDECGEWLNKQGKVDTE